MNIRQQLEQSLQRFEELEKQLSDPAVLSDSSKMAAVAREHGSLNKLANKFRHYKKMSDEMKDLALMAESEDAEERAMATTNSKDCELNEKHCGPSCSIRPSVAKMPIEPLRDGNPSWHRW